MNLLPQAAADRADALPFAARLLGFSALVLLPLLCFSSYSLWRDLARDRHDAQERVRLLALEAAADMQRELDRGHRLLAFLRERPEVAALDSAKCNTMLRGQLKLDPMLANAGVLDLQKRVVCSSVDLPTGLQVPLDGGRWWAEALITNRVLVPDPQTSPVLGKPVLGLVQALNNKSGIPEALMIVSVNLRALASHWAQMQLPPGSELTILNGDGVVVTRSPDPDGWIGKNLSVPLAALRTRLPDSTGGVVGPDGVRRIYSAMSMSQPGWTAIAGLPVDAVFAPARERLRSTLSWAAGALALALLLGVLLAHHLSAPLRQLQRSARAVADGRRDTRASESGPREFRNVSIEFNRMMDSLHAAERRAGRIQGLYETLSRTNRALMRGRDKQTLCTEVCAACVDAGHALLASVWLRDDQERLTMFASAGPVLTLYGSVDNMIDLRDPDVAKTPTGEAVLSGRAAVANDYLNDSRTSRWHDLARRHGVRGVAVVPLQRQGRVEAALVLHVAEPHWFDEPLMQLLGELADDIALGFDILDRDAARAQAEAQLVHSHERFQRLFQAAPLPAAVFDYPGGQLLDANLAFVEAQGMPLDQMRGRTYVELGFSPSDAQRLFQRLREQRGRLRQFEASIRQSDGRAHEVQINAEQIEFDGQPALLTLSVDMTLRKRTELALRESLERFELAASTGHVWAWRPDSGLKAPTALLDLLGFADEEMGTQPGLWLPEVHPQDRDLLLDTLRSHLRERTPLELEFRMRGRDGKEHWLHASGQAQWDDLGHVRQMAGIVFDVSEHRRMRDLAASREQEATGIVRSAAIGRLD